MPAASPLHPKLQEQVLLPKYSWRGRGSQAFAQAVPSPRNAIPCLFHMEESCSFPKTQAQVEGMEGVNIFTLCQRPREVSTLSESPG